MSEALLLDLREARASPGAPPLTFRTSGPRVALLGDASPVLGPLFGRGELASGSFEVLGEPIAPALLARLGRAPLDLPLPLELTPLDYARWSARLAGAPDRDARRLAAAACDAVGLGGFAHRPLSGLSLLLRRLAILAQAATSPLPLLVIESPLEGLDNEASAHLLAALGRLAATRPILLSVASAARGTPGETLVRGADDVVVLERGEVVEHGAPATLALGERTAPPSSSAERPPVAAGGDGLGGG